MDLNAGGKAPREASRRVFLLGTAALLATGCSDSSSEDVAPGDSVSTSTTTATDSSTTTAQTPSSTTQQPESVDEPAASSTVVEDEGSSDDPAGALTPAMFASLSTCTLLPESTAGPYPSRELLDRRDITDGYPGHPFRLGLRVIDTECVPIAGAGVDIWHTDASGDYSEYEDGGIGKDEGEGTTFCRGFQMTDANGIAEFQTIYPGWYSRRAVHIHVRVYVDGETVRTGQLYFDEAYTQSVYATGEYAQFGPPQTTWANDRIVGDPASDGTGIVLSPSQTPGGFGTLGLLNLGV